MSSFPTATALRSHGDDDSFIYRKFAGDRELKAGGMDGLRVTTRFRLNIPFGDAAFFDGENMFLVLVLRCRIVASGRAQEFNIEAEGPEVNMNTTVDWETADVQSDTNLNTGIDGNNQ
ncbi:hypothetical protein ETB97_010254 [Aspergillus alliaceus]|uniref:Uncharacterized protein n=1 Tax=Petromyces alliaceus TaxID=209559 RepID=A0A8H6AAV8_PETAA|nr:hypothetical protein ETB97_010254 [Aspergillus burnettii]